MSEDKKDFNLPKHGIAEEIDLEDSENNEGALQPYVRQPEALPMEKTNMNFCKAMKVQTSFTEAGRKFTRMKAPKTAWVHNLIYLNGHKFDFTGREYLRPIYDGKDKEVLLKTARQVEKCDTARQKFYMANGTIKTTVELAPGDKVISYDPTTMKITTDRIVGVEENGVRQVYRVFTKKKRYVEITKNHPLLKIEGWTPVKDLKVGDYIGLAHYGGCFGKINDKSEAAIIGYMIGDGYFGNPFSFSQLEGPILNDFIEVAKKYESISIREYSRVDLPNNKEIRALFNTLGLTKDLRSGDMCIPKKCFSYNKESTASLLRALWSTDGHCKNVTKSKTDLCYSSISKTLIYQILNLLLKFGIFSVVRENVPTLYKDTNKTAYILRIIGRRSIERFYKNIGPIPGKPFSLTKVTENNNCNKIPIGVNKLLCKKREEYKRDLSKKGKRFQGENSWQHNGLRINNTYDGYSYPKFKQFCEFHNDEELWNIYHSDVFWDEIVSIQPIGEEMTYAVQTEKHHTYVTNGIISHNSTFLSNNLTIMCSLLPFFKTLYVSPSHQQTRQFSNEKLKPVLERSPLISRYLQDTRVSNQVFEKGFTNGSFIFLRSAFLSADRARGISSDLLCCDELQDLLITNIPVIAQCLSHSKYGYHLYAGTPKTFDNTIEIYWQTSTQSEWMVPCSSCSSATGKKWNFLDEKNIGKKGPICKYCGKPLVVTGGQWQISKQSRLKGYRIPQLMVPWITGSLEQWGRLLYNFENYPESQFFNEVLGLSYDNASKPITRADVLLNCDSKTWFVNPYNLSKNDQELIRRMILFAGIDWGEGNDGTGKDVMGKIKTASYTVLTIGGYISNQKFKVIFAKRYMGKEIDPDFIVKDVVTICRKLGVRMIGSDWGHGWGVNNQLFRKFGPQKCMQFMYIDNQKEVRKWDPIGYKFQLLRNHVMSEIFYKFKEQGFLFPPIKRWDHFAKDMFNISVEYIEYQRKLRYVHRPSDPDDWFHSLVYCVQVAAIYHGKQGY
jgi:intein/homing endonuclease